MKISNVEPSLLHIMEQVEEDLKLSSDLQLEIIKTHSLFNKYYKILVEAKKFLKKEKNKLERITRKRSEYYLGKAEPEIYQQEPFGLKILKTDLPKYLASDTYVQEQQDKVEELESVVEYLENILQKHINTRGYQIKSVLDYLKFSNGQ